MSAEDDFLPIDGEVTELVAAPSPVAALLWLAFVVAVLSAPAVVIAAWRWAL